MTGKRKRKARKQGNKGFRRGGGLESVQKCPGKGTTATWLFGQRVRPDFQKGWCQGNWEGMCCAKRLTCGK